MSLLFGSNINSLSTASCVWSSCTTIEDWSQILTWLWPLEPRLRRQDTQDRRAKNVGEWFLQTEEFRSQRPVVGDINPMTQLCFAMEAREPAKLILYSVIRMNHEECEEEGNLSADKQRYWLIGDGQLARFG